MDMMCVPSVSRYPTVCPPVRFRVDRSILQNGAQSLFQKESVRYAPLPYTDITIGFHLRIVNNLEILDDVKRNYSQFDLATSMPAHDRHRF